MSADNSPRTSNPPAQSTPSDGAARDPRPKRRSLLEIGILAGVLLAVIVAGVIVAVRAQHGTGPVTWTVYVGSEDGYTYALDGKTGAVRWRHHDVAYRPVVADGMVYFLSGTGLSGSTTIDALRTSDGSLAWRYQIANYAFPWVAVDNSIVYAGSSGFEGVGQVFLIALEASSGKLLWQKPFDHALASSPSIRDGVLCVYTSDGTLYALHASDGSLIWRASVGYGVGTVIQADQAVYLGAFAEVYALDSSDGRVLWGVFPDQFAGGPYQLAVAYGTVYAAGNRLYALDAQTGAVRWTYQSAQPIPNPSIVADRAVFFRDYNHYVYAVSASDGLLVWRQPIDDYGLESIALAHGTVYASSPNGLYALRAGDGTGLWRFQATYTLFSPAVGP